MLPDDAGGGGGDAVGAGEDVDRAGENAGVRGRDAVPERTGAGPTDDAGAVYRFHVPPEESVSEAVVRAVASVTGRRAVDGGAATDALEPLYEAVDPDALDALFRRAGETGGGTVSFAYGGYEVTVESGAVVAVSRR